MMMMGTMGAGLFNETVVHVSGRMVSCKGIAIQLFEPCNISICMDDGWFIHGMLSRMSKELRCHMEAMLQDSSLALIFTAADANSMPSAVISCGCCSRISYVANCSLSARVIKTQILSSIHLACLQLA